MKIAIMNEPRSWEFLVESMHISENFVKKATTKPEYTNLLPFFVVADSDEDGEFVSMVLMIENGLTNIPVMMEELMVIKRKSLPFIPEKNTTLLIYPISFEDEDIDELLSFLQDEDIRIKMKDYFNEHLSNSGLDREFEYAKDQLLKSILTVETIEM